MKAILGSALLVGILAVAGCGASRGFVSDIGRGMRRGFISIPGLTKISESHGFRLCAGYKGTSLPAYCEPGGRLRSTRGFEQVWEPRPAAQPGPSQVVVDVFKTKSDAVAKHFMPIYAHTEGYTAMPEAAINSGIAAKIDSLGNNGRTEFRFAWTSGRLMVEVNVIGPKLTPSRARDVARRALPS
jgi:hypothetical protein